MKPQIKPCTYLMIDKLLQEKTSSEDFNHLLECTFCQTEIYKIEESLLHLKISVLRKNFSNQNENDISEYMEQIILKKDSINQNRLDVINTAIEQVGFLNYENFADNIPTPEYLKHIILENISDKKDSITEKIIIKISDGLKIIGNYIESMYILPDLDNAIAVRSKKSGDQDGQSTLNFFQKKDKNEIIRYHIVQDGPESILLTIKLENFESQPVSLGIRSNNQLVASQPFNNNYAYFHKLKTGDYQFEVNFSGTSSAFVIPLCIV